MNEHNFGIFLRTEPNITSPRAITKRISEGRKAENILKASLDIVVSNDDTMYEALLILRSMEDPAHGPMQNAVRKYYKFVNNKDFPRLKSYHSPKHP